MNLKPIKIHFIKSYEEKIIIQWYKYIARIMSWNLKNISERVGCFFTFSYLNIYIMYHCQAEYNHDQAFKLKKCSKTDGRRLKWNAYNLILADFCPCFLIHNLHNFDSVIFCTCKTYSIFINQILFSLILKYIYLQNCWTLNCVFMLSILTFMILTFFWKIENYNFLS